MCTQLIAEDAFRDFLSTLFFMNTAERSQKFGLLGRTTYGSKAQSEDARSAEMFSVFSRCNRWQHMFENVLEGIQ